MNARCMRFAAFVAVVVAASPMPDARAGEPSASPPKIRQIDLVHFSHTDYGFTDHPIVCRELQKRYLDLAIDGVLATRDGAPAARFFWTAETTVAVLDWWQAASPERRKDFLAAVSTGQLEISALPLNNTPFLDRAQWHTMLHWLPEDLWKQVHPQAAVQNDVNGFPRAGAVELLNRGIGYLFSGINEDSGGAPLQRPSAFWWKMPDGRRLLVYLNYSYPMGYWFFEPAEWRRGPVPRAADTHYRPPRAGDFLGSDEASVRKAHGHLLERLRGLEAQGFSYPTLTLSITNQWRIDNDPPLLPLADFVAAWNRLGLQPTLRLTTVSVAMKRIEEEVGDRIPTYEGEWTDWWANGTASAPREVAASRQAKRWIAAARSPIWGQLDPNSQRAIDGMLQDLCLFDEHTWGSSNSVALPYSLDAQGQFNEKAAFAYRPMARAEWLLAQRVRTRLAGANEGIYVANSAPLAYSGWVRMLTTALRDDYRALEDPQSGATQKMYFEPGLRPFSGPQNPGELTRENTAATFPDNAPRQVAKFWVEKLDGNTIRPLRLSTKDVGEDQTPQAGRDAKPSVRLDPSGWPSGIVWPGMAKPLFLPGMGDLVSAGVKGFAPRWIARDIWSANDAQREQLRKEKLDEVTAVADGKASVEENPHTLVYTQTVRHPRLAWGTRQLEVWKREPRAKLTFRVNRTSYEGPEVLYLAFPLPCEGTMPRTSCGGLPLVPFRDQLPGTCRDYFGIDGWVQYETPQGSWLWVSRDAPLVAFGGNQVLARRHDAPKEMHRVMAMVFNNFWYTNFVGDQHGVMEFQFDLCWRPKLEPDSVEKLAETLVSEPQVMIQPGLREDPIMIQRLYKP